jgi:serine/threonine-protein kinase
MTERFTLLSELGRGGMGVVWKARDEETGQIVALKLLRDVYAEDPDYVARFERELELAKRIHSPNVVQVLGYGVRDGTPYLALEYVDGPSLRERLTSHGAYSWEEARPLLAEIAQGLADAHSAGVIHRDLKPSNVLIGSDGVAKLADFGIAKGLDLTRVTGTSTLLGTPAYLPPEGPVDERSDLYSLGVIAYEILTGVVPFEGRTYQEVILRHVREAPNLEKLPKEARKTVGWLLAKDPKKRPQSAGELVAALTGRRKVPVAVAAIAPVIAATEPKSIIRPETDRRAPAASIIHPPRNRRRRTTLVVAGFVALALAFASGVTLLAALPAGASSASTSGPPDIGGLDVTASPGSNASVTVSAEPSSTESSNSTTSPGSSASVRASAAPTSSSTPASTGRATATPTGAPQLTPAPTPQPTLAPTPQPTPAPTPQPTQTGAYVSGVVTASEGGPLAGIGVTLVCQSGVCSYWSKSRSDGSYSVGPVAPGSYYAQFNDPNDRRASVYALADGATTCYTPDKFHYLDVGDLGLAGVNVAMTVGYHVSGTLTPASGKSLPSGMQVYLFTSDNSCGAGGASVGADGTYSSLAILAGSYAVEFMPSTRGTSLCWTASALIPSACPGGGTPVTITASSIGGINGQLPSDWP